MPKSISQVQKNFSFDVGEGADQFIEFNESANVFYSFGIKFKKVIGIIGNRKGVAASGHMIGDGCQFSISEDGQTMEITMPDYFDYPNQGVRGVNSSKNAPESPYKFKSYGMNAEGRKSIKDYILSGHAKISTVRKNNDAGLGIGREKKHLSLVDIQTNQLIYLIKRFGIKATNYFTETLDEAFKDFGPAMSEALGKDIAFTIDKLNRNGNNN